MEAFSWRIMNFVRKFEGRHEKQLVPWEKAQSRQQNKIPKTKIIINQHVKIANCHGWQMILSCIMLKNLAVNLPMSNKVDCAHCDGCLLVVVSNVHVQLLQSHLPLSRMQLERTNNKLVKKREDFPDVRLDYFFTYLHVYLLF